jgi:hypothetical protein
MSNEDHVPGPGERAADLPGPGERAADLPYLRFRYLDIPDISEPAGAANTIVGRISALIGDATTLTLAGTSPEETEASEILARVERELPSLEERTNRLMYRYGL